MKNRSTAKPKRLSPSATEVTLARGSSEVLHRLATEHSAPGIRILTPDARQEAVTVPTSALLLLAEVLDEMARGHEVVVSSVARELSTQEAAELLNVSRPFLIGLLEQGEIPFHRVGNRRRVRYDDLVRYKQKANDKADAAFRDLVAQAQDLGMGY